MSLPASWSRSEPGHGEIMKSCLSRLRVCWTKHVLYVVHAALWIAGLAAWLPLLQQDAHALLQEVELSELASARPQGVFTMPSRQLLGPLRPRQSCGPVPARFSCAATKEASAVASRIILDATARPETSTRPERTPPPSPRSLRSRARVRAALNCANFARNSARWWELPPPGAISSPPSSPRNPRSCGRGAAQP